MVGCDECSQWFYTERGLNIHKAKSHCENICVPNLIEMGIVKRKLTRSEIEQITKEVMSMELKDTNSRFIMAILKVIDISHSEPKKEKK